MYIKKILYIHFLLYKYINLKFIYKYLSQLYIKYINICVYKYITITNIKIYKNILFDKYVLIYTNQCIYKLT